jgi:hypothetical protein
MAKFMTAFAMCEDHSSPLRNAIDLALTTTASKDMNRRTHHTSRAAWQAWRIVTVSW